MNETINLTRARVIEFTDSGGDAECLVKRDHVSDLLFTGIRSNGPGTKLGSYRLKNIQKHCTNIRILAEFDLTLADLLPEGCTDFRFLGHNGMSRTASFNGTHWEVTRLGGAWGDLNELASDLAVNLGTVLPLQVHSQYVEERR